MFNIVVTKCWLMGCYFLEVDSASFARSLDSTFDHFDCLEVGTFVDPALVRFALSSEKD